MSISTKKRAAILQHLSKDKQLKPLLLDLEIQWPVARKDVYFELLRAITGQQLSIKAADTIWNRTLLLFKDQYPTARELIKLDIEKLRSAGLSYQKAGYLQNIARFHHTYGITYDTLQTMDNEAIISHLTQIKGVGRWTVEMLLMFSLQRLDVFPIDDLGVRQGMIKLYKVTLHGKEQRTLLHHIAQCWQPYASIACRYLWQYKDVK
jgi:DNA-3-methyladenine glycosylase II